LDSLAIVRDAYKVELQGSNINLIKRDDTVPSTDAIPEAIAQISRHKKNTIHVLQKTKKTYKAILAMDIETTHATPLLGEIKVISVYGEDIQLVTEDVNEVRHLLNDTEVLKIFHNASFDVTWLRTHGYSVKTYSRSHYSKNRLTGMIML